MLHRVTRRDFLKDLGGLGAMLFFNPLEATAEEAKDEFTFVEKIPKEDLRHLESLLTAPNPAAGDKQLYDSKGTVNLHVDRWPEVAYHLNMRESPDKLKVNITLNSIGNTFLLSSEGFFISVYHVFDEHIERRKQGDNSSVMLVYDPFAGFALPARHLIYSERYDLLLGRVRFENKPDVKTTYISDTDSPPLSCVYSTKYGKLEYISDGLLKEMLHSGRPDFETEGGQSRLTFRQERLVKKEQGNDLGCEVSIGKMIHIKYSGRKQPQKWEYTFLSEMISGNSGSPVFDLQSRLIGVITASDTITNLNTGKKQNIGIYIGPTKIQEMLRRYIAYCK